MEKQQTYDFPGSGVSTGVWGGVIGDIIAVFIADVVRPDAKGVFLGALPAAPVTLRHLSATVT